LYLLSFVCETATRAADLCSDVLPQTVTKALAQNFADWTIQSPSNLSPSAEERWKSEKPAACPGLARGHFEDGSKTSYAVLIVDASNQGSAAKLLLFSGSSTDMKVLEDTATGGKDLFIHAALASRFFDKKSSAKFGVRAPKAVLLFDAGSNEYETDIYFLTANGFRHEPVDH
jgi:hypothetical protein